MRTIKIDGDFETLLLCALRYCYGRRTYMPSLVIGYTIPLLPELSDNMLQLIYRDMETGDPWIFGDQDIDKPEWLRLKEATRKEIFRRRTGDEKHIK